MNLGNSVAGEVAGAQQQEVDDLGDNVAKEAQNLPNLVKTAEGLDKRISTEFPEVLSYEKENLRQVKRIEGDKSSSKETNNVESTVVVIDPAEIQKEIDRLNLKKKLAVALSQQKVIETGAVNTAPVYILEPRRYSKSEILYLSMMLSCNPGLNRFHDPRMEDAEIKKRRQRNELQKELTDKQQAEREEEANPDAYGLNPKSETGSEVLQHIQQNSDAESTEPDENQPD